MRRRLTAYLPGEKVKNPGCGKAKNSEVSRQVPSEYLVVCWNAWKASLMVASSPKNVRIESFLIMVIDNSE